MLKISACVLMILLPMTAQAAQAPRPMKCSEAVTVWQEWCSRTYVVPKNTGPMLIDAAEMKRCLRPLFREYGFREGKHYSLIANTETGWVEVKCKVK